MKKFISLGLAGAILISAPLTASAQSEKLILARPSTTANTNINLFSDIQNHWAENYINELAELGLINGYSTGEFKPNNQISREEAATIISALIDDMNSSSIAFSDTQGRWSEQYINKLAASGIVQGYNNQFNPENSITRGEFATMMSRLVDKENLLPESTTAYRYSDVDKHWAESHVYEIDTLGLVNGFDGKFNPNSPITRAEVVTVITRYLRVLDGEELFQSTITDEEIAQIVNASAEDIEKLRNTPMFKNVSDDEAYLMAVMFVLEHKAEELFFVNDDDERLGELKSIFLAGIEALEGKYFNRNGDVIKGEFAIDAEDLGLETTNGEIDFSNGQKLENEKDLIMIDKLVKYKEFIEGKAILYGFMGMLGGDELDKITDDEWLELERTLDISFLLQLYELSADLTNNSGNFEIVTMQ